jgi:hypothetical protein
MGIILLSVVVFIVVFTSPNLLRICKVMMFLAALFLIALPVLSLFSVFQSPRPISQQMKKDRMINGAAKITSGSAIAWGVVDVVFQSLKPQEQLEPRSQLEPGSREVLPLDETQIQLPSGGNVEASTNMVEISAREPYNAINLRALPNGAVIVPIKNGSRVIILDNSSNSAWIRVKYGNYHGWIYKKILISDVENQQFF